MLARLSCLSVVASVVAQDQTNTRPTNFLAAGPKKPDQAAATVDAPPGSTTITVKEGKVEVTSKPTATIDGDAAAAKPAETGEVRKTTETQPSDGKEAAGGTTIVLNPGGGDKSKDGEKAEPTTITVKDAKAPTDAQGKPTGKPADGTTITVKSGAKVEVTIDNKDGATTTQFQDGTTGQTQTLTTTTTTGKQLPLTEDATKTEEEEEPQHFYTKFFTWAFLLNSRPSFPTLSRSSHLCGLLAKSACAKPPAIRMHCPSS